MKSARVYVLGGYQTDYAKNWARAGKAISDMMTESEFRDLVRYLSELGRAEAR